MFTFLLEMPLLNLLSYLVGLFMGMYQPSLKTSQIASHEFWPFGCMLMSSPYPGKLSSSIQLGIIMGIRSHLSLVTSSIASVTQPKLNQFSNVHSLTGVFSGSLADLFLSF